MTPLPESKQEVELQFRKRRLAIDSLGVVPPWRLGAVAWLAFSELVLKRVYPDDFLKMQGALLAADTVSELPPGVAMVATLYSTLYLAERSEEITESFVKGLVKGVNYFVVSLAKVTGL